MPSVVPEFAYDIFISYRHNDNLDDWVTDLVQNLEKELRRTIKEPVTIYFDKNPHDGLLETHHVDKSLEGKLKCCIFIPIISQTYCDTKSFAWQHEFVAFNKLAKEDSFGRDIKVSNGNIASRILPLKIHDLDADDLAIIENELGGALRPIEFIYRSTGVNRPLTPSDNPEKNLSKTLYRDQVNKVANGVKEIIIGLRHFEKPLVDTAHTAKKSKSPSVVESGRLIRTTSIAFVILLLAGYLLFNVVKIIGLPHEEQVPLHKLIYPILVLSIAAIVGRQPTRKMGYTLMQISTISVFAGGVADVLFTFTSSSIPDPYIEFLQINEGNISNNLIRLEFALLRTLGTALIAVSLGCWLLLQSLAKQNSKASLVVFVAMITLTEGNNTLQMYVLGLPFYIYTITIVIITWIGALLWWKGDRHVLSNLSQE